MPEECANPLLLQWIKEWMDQAQERNSKGYTVYKKAYQSMKACPLKFSHPSEAQQLNGLGPKLCDRLTDKLKAYCAENGLPMPEKGGAKDKRQQADVAGDTEERPTKKPRKTQMYVPKLRSGPYALLMALAALDQDGSQAMTKNDLIEKAQPLCDSSFTTPSDPTKFFTAWNSMKTLESKELVCTKGHPTKRYSLSDEGWEVARRMKAAESRVSPTKSKSQRSTEGSHTSIAHSDISATQTRKWVGKQGSIVDIAELSSSPEPENTAAEPCSRLMSTERQRSTSQPNLEVSSLADCIILPSECYDIRLLLDSREIRTKSDRDYIADQLRKHDVVPIIRSLPLGDVLWVAEIKPAFVDRFKQSNLGDEDDGSTQIVLEHVMERKRLDDLIGSIKDGRFHEQKFRLRKSGIKHITYLVEDYSISAERSEKYGEAVESSIAAMQVVNDIFVKQTSKIDDTIRYLARMTRLLQESHSKKEIHVIPSQRLEATSHLSTLEKLREQSPTNVFGTTFSAFAAMCDKSDSMTLRDVYLRMLMCTRGVTGDKAIEIQKIWPTPRALIEAYEAVNQVKEKENLISSHLGNAIPRKKVAKALSAKIAEIWA